MHNLWVDDVWKLLAADALLLALEEPEEYKNLTEENILV